jgi:ribosomal protein L11 methyltransferase
MRMHEVAVTVDQADAESVIGRLVGLAPYGILDQPAGGSVILRIRGASGELRSAAEYAGVAGDAVLSVAERDIPDAWGDRRRLDYVPLIVAGMCVRPSWAPATEGVIDLVVDDGEAFGSGAHVTTRASLALLCELDARAPLADLGSGTGILSVAAAKRGFGPVIAVDSAATAVAATRIAAAQNRVALDVVQLDLLAEAAPFAPVVCANVPVGVHAAIAARIPDWPDFVIASGFATSEFEAVSSFYARLGLAPGRRIDGDGWTTCLFSADSDGQKTD